MSSVLTVTAAVFWRSSSLVPLAKSESVRDLAGYRAGRRPPVNSPRYHCVAGTRPRPRVLRRIRPGGGVDRARLSREPRIAPAELITGVSAFAASGYARRRCGSTFRELGYVGETPGTTCASHPRRDAHCRWGHVRQEPMVRGLSAGGRWIRTISPAAGGTGLFRDHLDRPPAPSPSREAA